MQSDIWEQPVATTKRDEFVPTMCTTNLVYRNTHHIGLVLHVRKTLLVFLCVCLLSVFFCYLGEGIWSWITTLIAKLLRTLRCTSAAGGAENLREGVPRSACSASGTAGALLST